MQTWAWALLHRGLVIWGNECSVVLFCFFSPQELVEFYQQNSLKDCFKSLDTTLQFPYKEPERRAINKPPAGSTKYFGTAKARYDFCARDRSELSLKEGDIIKILNKKGQQGWWRGEIYGRIGWFPSNYVEEDYSEYC